jgi:hypothetical protein
MPNPEPQHYGTLYFINVFDTFRNHPAKTITDKAYGRTPHFRPLHTEAELRMMGAEARTAAADFDKRHK